MSYLRLLKIHERLNEEFLFHQEALLDRDLITARQRLEVFEKDLRSHMQYEEEILLPIYCQAGPVPGGDPQLFTGEHEKMLAFLSRIKTMMLGIDSGTKDRNRQVIRIFDEEARLKGLMEHHDLREANILYPTLDRLESV